MKTKEFLVEWGSIPENSIHRVKNDLWAVRLGIVVNRPQKKKCVEDSFLILSEHHGEGNSTLGYTLLLKKEFPHFLQQDYYLSFFSDLTTRHADPKVVYKDQKLYLYKYGTKKPSYQMLLRSRIGN